MRFTFTYDKNAKQPHYKVRHRNIREPEFSEVFSSPVVVIGQRGQILKAVGRTLTGRFLSVVFLRRAGDHYHVVTAWPATRKQIVLWHQEMKKR